MRDLDAIIHETARIRSTVRFDRESREYVVRVTVGDVPIRGQDGTVEACEYRTDDHHDAINTGPRMVAEEAKRQRLAGCSCAVNEHHAGACMGPDCECHS